VLFRAQNIGLAWDFIKQLGSWGPATLWTAPAVAAIVIAIGLQLLPSRTVQAIEDWFGRLSPYLLGPALAVLILFVAATVPSQGVPPFIYFRF
jgi:hypothetical protein